MFGKKIEISILVVICAQCVESILDKVENKILLMGPSLVKRACIRVSKIFHLKS